MGAFTFIMCAVVFFSGVFVGIRLTLSTIENEPFYQYDTDTQNRAIEALLEKVAAEEKEG